MKIINPSVENITPSQYDLTSIYKHIEKCARTCYKSLDKITDDSYKKFCEMLKTNKHLSTYEHGTIYLQIPMSPFGVTGEGDAVAYRYSINPYSKCMTTGPNGWYYVTTNMRVIIENGWESDLKYMVEKPNAGERRYTFKVICDRAVSHEFVRHRTLSFSQESQRYCNYSKDKFGGNITFIKPHWVKDEYVTRFMEHPGDKSEFMWDTAKGEEQIASAALWMEHLQYAEEAYLTLLDNGIKPQDARAVLPNSCKTELVVTGFKSDWEHFLSLRSNKAGATGQHPDIDIIANMLYDYLNE